MGTDPFAMHDPLILMVLLVAALVAVPTLLGVALVRLARARRPGTSALPGLATLAAAATVGVYGRGLLGLVQDESSATEACQSVVGPDRAGELTGYETSFVPLRFACGLDDGAVEIFVPGWVSPTALVLAVVTTGLAVAARRAPGAGTAAPRSVAAGAAADERPATDD